MILSSSQRIYTVVLLNSYFLFLSQRTTFHSVLTSKLLLFPLKNLLVSRFSVSNIFSTQFTVHNTLVYRTQYSTHYRSILKSPSIHSRTSYCETKVYTSYYTARHNGEDYTWLINMYTHHKILLQSTPLVLSHAFLKAFLYKKNSLFVPNKKVNLYTESSSLFYFKAICLMFVMKPKLRQD